MPDDLKLSYQHATNTPYVIVRRLSDYFVYSTVTSAFAAWADGSIGDYDIALTHRGGDLWTADFPTAIAAGNYRLIWYESTGSPAITDLILKSRDVYWNGTVAVSGSAVTLSAYALTTLAGVKRHMRITSSADDTLLTELINQVSAYIERVTGRLFKARDYRIRQPSGCYRAVLPHYPVLYVNRVTYGMGEAMTISYSGAAIRANVSVYSDGDTPASGGVRLHTVNSSGASTTTTLAFSTYASASALATAIAAVSGWAATVVVNVPTSELHVAGGQNAVTDSVTLFHYSEQDTDSYNVNLSNGIVSYDYRRYDWAFGDYSPRGCCSGAVSIQDRGSMIEYRAGYETIPDDVDLLAREMVAELFYAGQRNTGVRSYSLGPYSVTFTDDQEQRVRSRLTAYMDGAAMVGSGA